MKLRHRIEIEIGTRTGEQTRVVRGSLMTLPARIMRFLFGDYAHVLVLQPGQTVNEIAIFEKKEREGGAYGSKTAL